MGPTTENQDRRIGEFYDGLSADFDQMTAFETRLVSERPFVRRLVEQHGIATALDAGSGTGFHSILLSQLGVRVTAADLSSAMLEALRRRASEMGLSVQIVHSSFSALPSLLLNPFDAVFCMGNTLPHILEEAELLEALSGFRRMLKAGGVLIVQMLNYERIVRDRQSVQNVREVEGATYIRSYDFQRDRLMFNVRKIVTRDGKTVEQRTSIPLRPWRVDDMVRVLVLAGFPQPEPFGSIALDRFIKEASKDLVIVARNPS